ncbi:MAG: mechanosensitive ion channel protein MscS [Flavobacterium sp. MedPE-SWcel]|uniref:mechanosensitive ion channel family protein n=1 Tax=uncultured Flavobacterium sp. TaxID=165435 RepID=UPI00091170D3|nr:mechanosensitive ion channel domain-containing protein [uncultured Flavobacterium sp.]OIQ15364.1 MAG: mechanosensitive ion channel protein MscS [Flavobacterium sp. MedPE-SWcel]
MDLLNWSYDVFKSMNFSDATALYGKLAVNLVSVIIIAYLLDFLSKKILVVAFGTFAAKTKTSFDDFLVKNKVSKYLAHLVPLLFVYYIVPLVLKDFIYWEIIFERGVNIFIIFIVLWIIRSTLNALKDYLKVQPNYSDKPIDSYIQVIMIMLWIFATIAIIMVMFSIDFLKIIGTFGAVSAVVLLIFKDTILGFVASIQVSVNDLVRIGDWITMEKYGADGDVIEINLATVKVKNFDNTTTTVPTYSLISDSFKNWRGMVNSGGRRIKRHVLIKANSVHFLDESDIEKFKKIQLLTSYIDHRQQDIEEYNSLNHIDRVMGLNGRSLTNLGLFRKYINQYIETHPAINKDLTMMCRHLQPTEKGIPIEVYAFTSDKRWVNYEYIMADIFDHIIASVKFFDLEVFELPSNGDAFIEGDN